MEEKTFILGVLVSNEFGVLTRVAGLFARRGFNIDSLTVGETEVPGLSRMTISATGDDYIKTQIVKQLQKLHDVKKVDILSDEQIVTRELMLIKVNVEQDKHAEVMEAVKVYRAKIVDLCAQAITVEITGESDKLDAFIDYVRPYGIAELCRTGITSINRGSRCLCGQMQSQNLKSEGEENNG